MGKFGVPINVRSFEFVLPPKPKSISNLVAFREPFLGKRIFPELLHFLFHFISFGGTNDSEIYSSNYLHY